MSEKPFMYSHMSERDVYRWQLGYTMGWIIETFESIPDEALCVRPRPNINAPAWIFGHVATTERLHVGGLLQGVSDIPEPYRIFRGPAPAEEVLREAVESKQTLIDYWRSVRAQTEAYLDSITDADLKEIPKKSLLDDNDPNRNNPIREWFVMTIKHQNRHWGQLDVIGKVLADA